MADGRGQRVVFGLALALLLPAAWRNTEPQALANEGYRRLWAGRTDGPDGAVAAFREAMLKDPAFPYRWSDLAQALADAGRVDDARFCFARALELGPGSPQIALRAANFYFGRGEADAGLKLGAGILARVRDYDDMVFSGYRRFGPDSARTWNVGIGDNRRAAQAYLRFLLRSPAGPGTEATAETGWAWIVSRGFADRRLAREWSDWLSMRNRVPEAAEVWKRSVATDPAGYRVTNWLDNAGFEDEWAGIGFDWHVESVAGVSASADDKVFYSGKRSLRLDFDATENVDYRGVYQNVWLGPGTYRLSARIRTAGLSTDEGVSARVFVAGAPLASTRSLSGTNGWTEVSAGFALGPGPKMARVEIARRPSLKFDNKPRGTAWVDGMVLARVR
jgi:hypothetical protein